MRAETLGPRTIEVEMRGDDSRTDSQELRESWPGVGAKGVPGKMKRTGEYDP